MICTFPPFSAACANMRLLLTNKLIKNKPKSPQSNRTKTKAKQIMSFCGRICAIIPHLHSVCGYLFIEVSRKILKLCSLSFIGFNNNSHNSQLFFLRIIKILALILYDINSAHEQEYEFACKSHGVRLLSFTDFGDISHKGIKNNFFFLRSTSLKLIFSKYSFIHFLSGSEIEPKKFTHLRV